MSKHVNDGAHVHNVVHRPYVVKPARVMPDWEHANYLVPGFEARVMFALFKAPGEPFGSYLMRAKIRITD